jgi:orotidine-5'-phosphate decarboxylase
LDDFGVDSLKISCILNKIGSEGNRLTSFTQQLRQSIEERGPLCIGLDPVPSRIPAHLGTGVKAVRTFLESILQETAGLAAAYKPNMGFFEALGIEGLQLLVEIRQRCPRGSIWLLDAKRGDIGNTGKAYAKAVFEVFGADAVTVNPYLGRDAVEPFMADPSKGVFLLCRTSNPGAADFQSLGSPPLFLQVAKTAQIWNDNNNIGLVVGATMPEELIEVRQIAPDLPLLIPGVGAQGGRLEDVVVPALLDPPGLALISASRSILYASSGGDFAEAAGKEAKKTQDDIRRIITDFRGE